MRVKERRTKPEQFCRRLADLTNGRDEMNLCELPFATLSERTNGRSILRFEVEDVERESGQRIRRRLTVKGDPEFGLPTEKDEEIYLGLLKYTNDYNGFSDPNVRLSRSELFELMDWAKSDWAYARLTKGMHRLVGVRLSYENLWRDNRNKEWRDQGAFGILDSFEFRDSRVVGSSASFAEQCSVFRWGSVLFQSFDSGYLKRIDYGLTRRLGPTARRLYRYLDKHFHPPLKKRITIDLARLAYQHVGISAGVELDKVRNRHIGPAAEELEQAGFLKPSREGRFQRVRRGVWQVTFELAVSSGKGDGAQDERVKRHVSALRRRGVSMERAVELAASYETADIKNAIHALDEQVQSGNQIRNVDAWLNTALKRGYQPSAARLQRPRRPELRVFRGPASSK